MTPEAQRRYRARKQLEALLVLVPVITLDVGQVAALIGTLLDGTDAGSPYLPLTAGALVCSFGIIVSAALGELVRDTFDERSSGPAAPGA